MNLINVTLKGKKDDSTKGKKDDSTFDGKIFKFINKGKAKQIYADPTNSKTLSNKESIFYKTNKNTVLCFANSKSKQGEIESEFQVAKIIKEKLSGAGIEEESNILLDMERVEGTNKYALRMEQAVGDLDSMIKILTPAQRLTVVRDVMNGINNLHKAGYIHGDLKPDNILLFKNKDESITARIADLGKTEECDKDQTIRQKGNPRWADPSGRISLKSEEWSAAALCTHILEMQHIKGNQKVLLEPKSEKPSFLQPKEKSSRIGFVLFLLKSKDCPQVDNNLGIGGKPGEVYKLMRQAKLGLTKQPTNIGERTDAKATKAEVDRYLDALQEAQKKDRTFNEDIRTDIHEVLGNLTDPDPAFRNLDKAIYQWDKIIEKLPK